MRLKDMGVLRGIAFWTGVLLVLCALSPEAGASGLIRIMPSVWPTATALGLTLVTAVSLNRR